MFIVPKEREVPLGVVIPSPVKDNREMITSNWRSRRPFMRYLDKCNLCRNCYIFCPDGCWTVDEENEAVVWNPDFCKGCLICVTECSAKALDAADELDFDGGVIRLEKSF
jgi:pyruvate ferredoxin oxidoreductase delta subunit